MYINDLMYYFLDFVFSCLEFCKIKLQDEDVTSIVILAILFFLVGLTSCICIHISRSMKFLSRKARFIIFSDA